jgi:hypothetical protein
VYVPGPLQKPNARRRRHPAVDLPVEGRSGPAPEFPLKDPSEVELAIFSELWRTLQSPNGPGLA